jgi:hypothetical protein
MRYQPTLAKSQDEQPPTEPHPVPLALVTPPHRGALFPNFISVAILAYAILGLFVGQHKARQDSRKAVAANHRLRADLARISPSESDLIVCWGCCFPYEALLPLESPRVLNHVNLLSLGWPQQSPVNDAVKQQFGVTDLTMSLFDNPHVYLLGQGYELPYYGTYIREHYQLDSEWKECYDGTDFKLFKPVRQNTAGDTALKSAVATSQDADQSQR